MLHKLAWMDPDWLLTDQPTAALVAKQRDYDEADKRVLRAVELELLRAVIPAYRELAADGSSRASTSPFYHPILPLLCDTDVHLRAHPHSPLPRQLFARPARRACSKSSARARRFISRLFGATPRACGRRKGRCQTRSSSSSDCAGCRWTATDEEHPRALAAARGNRRRAVSPV